ncbi:MAG: hypothetical protein GY928_21390 [Colwellia sp.]|nr:hypothetical protein [Colwellia sp.]
MKIDVIIPLNDWYVGKKKYNLSMNTYRNLHYQISNKLKKQVGEFLLQYQFKKYSKVKIHYTLYFKDKVKRDLLNFVAVVDKFALDSLVERGVLEDDNYNYVVGYTVAYGGKKEINCIKMEIEEC